MFQVLLDVKKTHDSLDRSCCMEILRGYVIGANMKQLLGRYWDGQRVVPSARRYYG